MKILNNFFSASYKSYDNYDSFGNPRFSSITLTFVIISGFAFMTLALFRKFFNISIDFFLNTGSMAAFGIGLLVLLIKYYSPARIQLILERYETKTLFEKRCWGFFTIILVVLPFTILIIVSSKPHIN